MDRKQHWEQIYARKPPCELSWHQDEPVTSLELIRSTASGPAARFFDVGDGGPGCMLWQQTAETHIPPDGRRQEFGY